MQVNSPGRLKPAAKTGQWLVVLFLATVVTVNLPPAGKILFGVALLFFAVFWKWNSRNTSVKRNPSLSTVLGLIGVISLITGSGAVLPSGLDEPHQASNTTMPLPAKTKVENVAQFGPPASAKPSEEDIQFSQMRWIVLGEEAVTARLRDPGSSSFRNIFFSRGKDKIPMTCGQVNSKNGFGGYTGYQSFVSAGQADLTFLEHEVTDFQVIWKRYCSDRRGRMVP